MGHAPQSADECADFLTEVARTSPAARAAKRLILPEIDAFHAHSRALAVRSLAGQMGANHSPTPIQQLRRVPVPQILDNLECLIGA